MWQQQVGVSHPVPAAPPVRRIGGILKNQSATNFVVVCIAEFLSINETKRLLGQLQTDGVGCSHVVVNQLVVNSLSEAGLMQ